MSVVAFVTHPEVAIDPAVPVPRWHLADGGIRRMRVFAREAAAFAFTSMWASDETKAIEAAGILAASLGLPVGLHAGLRENDRSATGFLPPAEFEQVADRFFAEPTTSVRGWERAVDAQARVVGAVRDVTASAPPGSIAIVAHGAVGALLQAHLRRRPIGRDLDQPHQGHVFVFDRDEGRLICGWRPIAPRET